MSGLVSFELCEGNPGALTFMITAYNPGKDYVDLFKTEAAFKRMEKAGIRGDKLYMLWNDCCDRDTEKTLEIMRTKDIEDIKTHINYEGGRGFAFEE